MRRPITAQELANFYHFIGRALWQIQNLENILVGFLAMKIVHERRCAGNAVTGDDVQTLIAEKRKITLGPLIETCLSHKVIQRAHERRFAAFKLERHWLVHQSLVENGDDLYVDATRYAVFERLTAIEEEAIALREIVFEDFKSWMVARGVNVDAATQQAAETIRKLGGG